MNPSIDKMRKSAIIHLLFWIDSFESRQDWKISTLSKTKTQELYVLMFLSL